MTPPAPTPSAPPFAPPTSRGGPVRDPGLPTPRALRLHCRPRAAAIVLSTPRVARPGSKVNQARPGTQDTHPPQGAALHRPTRSPDAAAVQPARSTPPRPPGAPPRSPAGPRSSARHQIQILPSRGISGARASATAPARHRKLPRRPGRAPGPPGHTCASRAGAAPLTPRPPLRQEGGGAAGAPAAGIHPRGVPQPSPGLSPPNLNSPQQEDPGGQGLRHGPSPAQQAAQAAREGSRSPGPCPRFARRCGAAHPAPPSTTGGGGAAGAPAAGIHPRGAPQLSPGLSPPLNPRQTTSSGPQSPPQIRRAQLAAAAILSSSSREQPGHRMRVSRRLFINSSRQTSLQVPGTPGRHV
ncbi:hypothetical protein NDU88_010726 [Pleurodeles waltl]|uniref:Basic proline-rich protein-like n=1 Tax=Pleurodeles waltl TaxID=8319 RepID=A0AAV7S491_PLEWA|nr:hypothetical protein NDU88_010726 [Pleurodeles waltl]